VISAGYQQAVGGVNPRAVGGVFLVYNPFSTGSWGHKPIIIITYICIPLVSDG